MAVADQLQQIDTNLNLIRTSGNALGFSCAWMRRLLTSPGAGTPLVEQAVARWLEAYDAYQLGQADRVSRSWEVALDSAAQRQWRERLVPLQQLALIAHVHVLFDLPLALYALADNKEQLAALKDDFSAHTKRVGELMTALRGELVRTSPQQELLATWGVITDDDLFGLQLGRCRKLAWQMAGRFVRMKPDELQRAVDAYDSLVAELGRQLRDPDAKAIPLLEFVRRFDADREPNGVADVIAALEGAVGAAS